MTRPPARLEAVDVRLGYRTRFRRREVLLGVHLSAEPGSVTAIIGRNGAGKTTLFRVMLGFHAPDGGRVTIAGQPSTRYRVEHGVGHLPEAVTFPAGWSVRDVLARGVDLTLPGARRTDEFDRAVAESGLEEDALTRALGRCSKGMRQRVALAYALIGEPAIVFLDEPYSGLDPPSRTSLRASLVRARDRGATVVLASHDLAEVARVAERIYRLEAGVVRLESDPAMGGATSGADLEAGFDPAGPP